MDFSSLTFPLTVDFGTDGYWIGNAGPHPYGTAVTAFFCRENFADDELLLKQELEQHLQALGGHLQPYAQEITADVALLLEQPAACTVCFARRGDDIVERYSFSSLRDFLYMELGKAIRIGNAPRQCRLCGQWFLHEQGDRAIYCGRTAPGETKKTCREVGARAVFESKIQSEEPWKIYKRAYKKYYARVMKGHMSREDFNAWAEQAVVWRDATLLELEAAQEAEARIALIEELRKELNKA